MNTYVMLWEIFYCSPYIDCKQNILIFKVIIIFMMLSAIHLNQTCTRQLDVLINCHLKVTKHVSCILHLYINTFGPYCFYLFSLMLIGQVLCIRKHYAGGSLG